MSTITLPNRFSELNAFVEAWALPTEAQRKEKRASSSFEDLQAFAAAVGPWVREIGNYLDGFAMGQLAPPQRKLLELALIYMDVALAVEFYRRPEPVGAFPRERFIADFIPQPEDGRLGTYKNS